MQANILCLETSAAQCSVAVSYGDDQSLVITSQKDFSHVSQITTLIKELLDKVHLDFQSLDAVAISGGPGSYTGLRVGASTAKGICFGMDIPLIAINTLEAIANASKEQSNSKSNALYISVIDARRDEVYLSAYDADMNLIIPPKAYILTNDSFREEVEQYDQVIITGDAAAKAREIIENPQLEYLEIVPSAEHLIPLAKNAHINQIYVEIGSYKPYYLKPPNITVSKKQFFRKN